MRYSSFSHGFLCRFVCMVNFICFTLQVLTNALGAVHLFASSKRALFALRDDRVIPVVVQLLNVTENAVLINATKVLAVCAREAACRR